MSGYKDSTQEGEFGGGKQLGEEGNEGRGIQSHLVFGQSTTPTQPWPKRFVTLSRHQRQMSALDWSSLSPLWTVDLGWPSTCTPQPSPLLS
jgi:hypothetical protein